MNEKKFYQQIPAFKLTLWQLNLLISLLFVAVFNVYLWHDLIISLQPESFADYAFLLSIFMLLVLVINLVLTVLIGQRLIQLSPKLMPKN